MTRPLTAVATILVCARVAGAQPVSEAIGNLTSPRAEVRLGAVRELKAAAAPETAAALAPLLVDEDDGVQLEAIAAEVNIFLASKVVPARRIALVVEVRNKVSAETTFAAGPLALSGSPVPSQVLAGLLRAAHDEHPQVAREAVYAFGALAADPGGITRRELLRSAGPELAAVLGVPDPALRAAAARVIGRVFAGRAQDEPVDQTVGDALITMLNDDGREVQAAAMEALGALRYERALQGLTDLFQYYGRGPLADAALDAVARIGHPSSAPVFAAELAGKHATRKLLAIEGFARTGDRQRLPDIQAALAGERREALLLAGNFAAVRLANGTLDPIIEGLKLPRVRDQALLYLLELAPGNAAAFASRAQDPDGQLRALIADALGLSGDAAALAVVEPLIRDSDPAVAFAATRATARLRALQ